jgi:hypothetical protein
MGKELNLYRHWQSAKAELDKLFESPDNVVVIHYSCESFYDRESSQSPRVTSIAVRNLGSGQTQSFSIHLVAEQRKLLDGIEEHYDELELEMLREFFEYTRIHQQFEWLHWNMRDANYGFQALEHRYRVLSGTPFHLDEGRLHDLARILIGIYGVGYIGHPRMENLIAKNHISDKDYLAGRDEAAAFDNKHFLKLHQSTLRKVDILANIAGRATHGELITLAGWWEMHGRSFKVTIEWLKEHWVINAIWIIGAAVAAAFKIYQAFAG